MRAHLPPVRLLRVRSLLAAVLSALAPAVVLPVPAAAVSPARVVVPPLVAGGPGVDGAGGGGPSPAVQAVGRYAPPVDRPVRDPFRAPAGTYGPGNRGLEYDTAGGEPVRTMGAGVVAFAGPVAGRLVVSVVHPDGLRSSLTGLASVSVRVGAVVAAGTLVGTAGPALHLGVRRGRTYLDPASLLGGTVRPRHAVLVPVGPGTRWGASAPLR